MSHPSIAAGFLVVFGFAGSCWAEFRPALARVELDRGRVAPGQTIQATYTFLPSGPAEGDFRVFVHIKRPHGGGDIGADFEPALCTLDWPTGKFVCEGPHPIVIPPDAKPGKYPILVGIYGHNSPRVELNNPDRHQGDRRYLVGHLEVAAADSEVKGKPVCFEILPVNPEKLVRAPTEEATSANLPTFKLANERLTIELYADRPVAKSYLHKSTGQQFAGGGPAGRLVINGKPIRWDRFNIKTTRTPYKVSYNLALPDRNMTFDMVFTLEENTLAVELGSVKDPKKKLKTIGWKNVPLLVCADPEYRFWRLCTGGPDARSGGKMWMQDRGGQIKSSPPESGPAPVIYGSLHRPDKLCVFVHSNYPLFPMTHRVNANGEYEIGLNTYQYRVRHKTMPPLRAEVVFTPDENGDGRADLSDYRRWVNRRLPDADPIYHTHIWYKIFLDHASGVWTTLPQAREIIEAIHNVTDGLPQIPYLVGWQQGGHDHKYPSMDAINPRIGGAAALRKLFEVCKGRYNTILSYHQNIDDAYENSNDWDPDFCGPNGICHTVDVEKGAIFRRLDTMLQTTSVEKTLHFDNMRITNTHTAKGFEGHRDHRGAGLRADAGDGLPAKQGHYHHHRGTKRDALRRVASRAGLLALRLSFQRVATVPPQARRRRKRKPRRRPHPNGLRHGILHSPGFLLSAFRPTVRGPRNLA